MAVLEAAVVEELLAVIGGQDHERLREQTAFVELGEEAAELAIDERDLFVVGVAQELHVERFAAALRVTDLEDVRALFRRRGAAR